MSISGIYLIINSINGKIYIGSAVDIESRWKRHVYELNNFCHVNKHLQNAWNKYGEDAFHFCIVEECEKENLLKIEQLWINGGTDYNIYLSAGSPLGFKHTEETKLILSNLAKNKTEYHKSILSKVHKGKIISSEIRAKMSASMKGIKRSLESRINIKASKQNISIETRKKMSEAQKKRYSKT